MSPSFRTRILLVVIVVAVLPLSIVGLWLSGSTRRSGEELLRLRVAEDLARDAAALELGWIRYRSQLLDLADHPLMRRALAGGEPLPADSLPALLARLDPIIQMAVLRDADGREVARLERPLATVAGLGFGAPFAPLLGIHDPATGEEVGSLEALLPIQALRRGEGSGSRGAVLGAFDPRTGAVLLPLPFEPELFSSDRLTWAGEEWLVMHHPVVEPRVDLAAAIPLSAFAAPFESAAARGGLLLALAALAAVALVVLLTGRLTRSLEELAAAADSVAAGRLERSVDSEGDDEVGRVARAFNTMLASLRRTLDQLAERESLVAVNEFAAALAHEVRNPLSSIRLDLQEVEESLPRDSPLRTLQERALEDLGRLDRTVAAALDTARSGRVEPTPIDLLEPVRGALRAAAPALEQSGARVTAPAEDAPALPVRADGDALERVLLNLLLNAARAVDGRGGEVRVEVACEGEHAEVRVHDDGVGMSPEALGRAFESFYTTRPGGSGIGLTVARRIVSAHRGELILRSRPGEGTEALVRLPAQG